MCIRTFVNGDTEAWLTWLKDFERLINLKSWSSSGPVQFRNARILLRDLALNQFELAMKGLTAEMKRQRTSRLPCRKWPERSYTPTLENTSMSAFAP